MDYVRGAGRATIALKNNYLPNCLICFNAKAQMHPKQYFWFHLYQVFYFGNVLGIEI